MSRDVAVGDDERLARAALLRVFEPGRLDLFGLVAERGPVDVWERLRDQAPLPELKRDVVAGARHRAQGYDPRNDLRAAGKVGARLVCPGDDEWPDAFEWPPDVLADAPPLGVYVRGDRPLAEAAAQSVAVVGARAATEYGLWVAREMAFGLADTDITVISGGAYGIDSAAHRGALSAQRAPTVAVLACGIDVVYPSGHDGLFRAILGRGLLVSELPVGSAAYRSRFLVRNRLIAALSLGTVVVEAAARSGSLATANRAMSLSRHVMAVPGPVTSATSAGSNQLLRNDAQCVTSAAEVAELVGAIGQHLAPEAAREQRTRDELAPTVRQVLDAVPVRTSAGIASIARTAGVAPLVVQQVLPPLVLHGLVAQTSDGYRLTALGAGRRGGAA